MHFMVPSPVLNPQPLPPSESSIDNLLSIGQNTQYSRVPVSHYWQWFQGQTTCNILVGHACGPEPTDLLATSGYLHETALKEPRGFK